EMHLIATPGEHLGPIRAPGRFMDIRRMGQGDHCLSSACFPELNPITTPGEYLGPILAPSRFIDIRRMMQDDRLPLIVRDPHANHLVVARGEQGGSISAPE